MKKTLLVSLLLSLFIILFKFYFSDYIIEYKLNNHNISIIYKKSRYYFEIDKKYNFDLYDHRSFSREKIINIKDIKGEDFECVYPIIKNTKTYPLCYKDNSFIEYTLIDSDLLNEYKSEEIIDEVSDNTFNYYSNLDNNTFIALWNYKGYIIMHGDKYENIEFFSNDRYDNSLSYMINNYIYMPNYDQEFEFNSIIKFDITNGKKTIINLEYTIDYDSYIVGSIKNNLYIFDNKHSILYEINVKKGKTNIKGSNEIGYVKYENKEFISCSKSEYKVNKITYNKDNSIYEYNFNEYLYKSINDNKKIRIIINNKDVFIISEYKNALYYISEDYLYKYTPEYGNNKIFYFFELNFNKDNTIFVYNK